MSALDRIRENWQIILLVILLVVSGVALFVPGVVGGSSDGSTNLQYGLELDGGSRIRAPVVGMKVELSVDQFGNETAPGEVESTLSGELGVERQDVRVLVPRERGDNVRTVAVEVFADDTHGNVTPEEFAAALRATGFGGVTVDDVEDGVTAKTRSEMVGTIRTKISEAGFAGRTVRQATTVDGEHFIVVAVPDKDPDEVRELISSRGRVTVDAYYRNESGTYVQKTVLTGPEMENIGSVQQEQNSDTYFVPIVVSDDVSGRFAQDMVDGGFQSGSQCTYTQNPNGTDPCLLVVVDNQVVDAYGVQPDLGRAFVGGPNSDFANDPSFRIMAPNYSEARDIRINLQAGSLRAPLDFEEATTFQIRPALAEDFKRNSLITGVIAVLAVSIVVFIRYNDVRVAAPMIVTALSEVALLLGFAAAIQLQLDLSHIAGFIAVVGTGADDLIIIADEVLSEGEVHSARVFQNRFRKAFWVIGAAAATTIVAMSPLAYLSLGDLRGFAIITILGVLIGVLITRPAYGNILRTLTTDQ
ncbi:MAG TPA: preprotein translocase subunit SecD [Natrialbaceae archaeon]|nr:preprotein translocase subunit SecD [Natrialbaceae archaeon]